ncbi:hypothetical protein JAAARDRAFT_40426 [Jaapia argillacea MUCL 33604]|uniref:Uncharacterized protein n=1 Tax=Jaapia argillacea MUCL 33604 TaxID=933084 RepID=A0A067PM65_9AGAM|nr:hypothetical protein JAAARDRAFT_40426 [Jaapia argillacea MUCL 33604]
MRRRDEEFCAEKGLRDSKVWSRGQPTRHRHQTRHCTSTNSAAHCWGMSSARSQSYDAPQIVPLLPHFDLPKNRELELPPPQGLSLKPPTLSHNSTFSSRSPYS